MLDYSPLGSVSAYGGNAMADKLTFREYSIIEAHLRHSIESCDTGIKRTKQMLEIAPSDQTKQQLSYWRHARSAIVWSLNIAWQRTEGNSNVQRPTL